MICSNALPYRSLCLLVSQSQKMSLLYVSVMHWLSALLSRVIMDRDPNSFSQNDSALNKYLFKNEYKYGPVLIQFDH
jgi:hypothetical protein